MEPNNAIWDKIYHRVAQTTCCLGAKHRKLVPIKISDNFLPFGHRQRVAGVTHCLEFPVYPGKCDENK
ncbi:MAG: hypothetical protein JRI91_10545 [Deltaproteobacteria bacterium]|nr:hypothetical protein [Deltaproteobacteria bacterium]